MFRRRQSWSFTSALYHPCRTASRAPGSPTWCVSAKVNKSFDKLPRKSTSETKSTVVGDPADAPRRRPTIRSSQASPSDLSVAEVSDRSESGTGGANGKRLAVATRATVLTTEVRASARDEGAVFAKVTGLARPETRGGELPL